MKTEDSNMTNSDDRDRSRERDRIRRSDRPNRVTSNSRDRSRDKSDRNRKIADRRIYVSNIPYDFRWQDLKDLFRTEVGKVAHVELFTDENDKPRGCGIVEFEDSESVKVAVEKMHRFDIKGRKLVVKEDYDVERDKYGRLTSGRVSDRGREERFRDQSRLISGRQNIQVSNSVGVGSGASSGGSSAGTGNVDNKFGNTYGLSTQFLESLGINGPLVTRIFVANLDYKVDEKKLLEVFKLAGKVLHVELGKDKDGKSRGFGVVEYDHPVESVQAISMLHNQQLYDRRMTVRLDRANEPDMPPKLPEGLKSIGMGLGAGGNRLTDVARNIPNVQPSNLPVANSLTTPVIPTSAFGTSLSNVVPAQLATALSNTNAAALQASLASGLGANLATTSLLNTSLSNELASNFGPSAASLANLQASLVNAQSNNSLLSRGLSKLDTEPAFGGNIAFGNSTFSSSRDFDSSFNRNDPERVTIGGTFSTNPPQLSVNRQNSNGSRQISDTILIGNLPPNTTWQMLRDKCQDIGEVKYAEMRGNDLGLVRFASDWDAERAVSLITGPDMNILITFDQVVNGGGGGCKQLLYPFYMACYNNRLYFVLGPYDVYYKGYRSKNSFIDTTDKSDNESNSNSTSTTFDQSSDSTVSDDKQSSERCLPSLSKETSSFGTDIRDLSSVKISKEKVKELVSTNPNQRNWRGILIALLVIIAVLALIVTSVALLTPPEEGPRIKGLRISLSNVLYGELAPLLFNGSWVSNKHICYRDSEGGISLLDISDSNSTAQTIMPKEIFRRLSPTKFTLSPDHKYLLLTQNVKKLFRYSFLAQYTVYDLNTREVIAVTLHPEKDSHPYLLLAQWTPRDHGLLLIQDYDIYYRISPFSSFAYRVTNTAVPGVLSNGLPDWLYEEEILHSSEAVWMSKDSHILLYASFNDSLVKEIYTSWYGDGNKHLYPEIRSLRYPKPDTPNPTVVLFVADLADPKNIHTKMVRPPIIMEKTEHYFTTAAWISPTEVCITWLNRFQNLSVISICKSPLWKCQEIQKIISDDHGWVDTPSEPPIFSNNGSSYIATAPVKDGPSGCYRHIVWVNILKRQVIPLTHGKLEVVKILAWDQTNNIIYFIGILSKKPSQRHLYSISSLIPSVGNSLNSANCLSCAIVISPSQYHQQNYTAGLALMNSKNTKNKHRNFSDIEEERKIKSLISNSVFWRKNMKSEESLPQEEKCQYFDAMFSPRLEYFILQCLGPTIPSVSVFKASLPVPRFHILLQNNTILKEKIASTAFPQIKMFPVQVSGGYNAQVKLYLPPGLREDEITQYPLIVHVYGAPGSQLVTNIFKVDWNTYLASSKNFIVAQIDSRGSGGQGYKLLHEIHNRLGTVEVSDQLEVTEYLRDSLHFVDKRRVAIWGWSYGGFIAAHVLAHPNQNIFHCGISVAPIVSWKLYDSAYAERFMGSPNISWNQKGYDEADLSRKVENLRNKMFYLVHGSADDNVQLQQTMILSHHLAEKSILFRQQIYPDVGHNLAGVKEHLYLSMAKFFDDCFEKQIPIDSKVGLSSGGTGSH